MRRRFRVIAMASCFLGSMALSGCAAAAQDGDLPRAPEPPDSALLSGDRAVTGEIGSYCWSTGSGGSCVDAVYPLVPGKEKTLAVPAGSDMVFDYGGEGPPDSVRARAEPLGSEGEPDDSLSSPLQSGVSGGRATIPAELPAGEYVVDVSVTVPEGDASYYFRVAVERDEAALPATAAAEAQEGQIALPETGGPAGLRALILFAAASSAAGAVLALRAQR